MKTKIILISLFALLELLLILGLFGIYPITSVPAAFTEKKLIESRIISLEIIRDSFIYTKALSSHVTLQMKKEYGWSLLGSLEKQHGIEIKLYDLRGRRSLAPDRKDTNDDPRVIRVIQEESLITEYDAGRLYAALPVFAEQDCLVCHRGQKEGGLTGVMTFMLEENFDSQLIPERKVVLITLLLINTLFLALSLQYRPFSGINKLFDN